MTKKLVIVESPGKIKKITEYLGDDYLVKASFGHIMDLDPKTLSIDVENNFQPNYIVCQDKLKTVKEFKLLAKTHEVIIASDSDREGEAIGWFIQDTLKLINPKRIIFHEITKKAITEAIENPTKIDMNMVHAQQARRLLDRLVGYKISPILWKHMNNDSNAVQSAGRVQSVVLKIICDKEEEINKSINEPYFKTTVQLLYKKNKINGTLMNDKDLYLFKSKEESISFLEKINKTSIFKVIDVQDKKSIRKPAAPFITSSLQQEASTKLKFNVKKTMQVAQKLYEDGYITYMRTDSTALSKDAISACKKYIIKIWGTKYSNPVPYNNKNENSQEAHEAIRPTNFELSELEKCGKDETKLYSLIWKRTIASQMSPAELNIQTIKIDTLNNISILPNKSLWICIFESIIFDGFLILYNDKNEDDITDENVEKKDKKIELNIDNILNFDNIKVSEKYTKLPLRFNEANLVKYLENNAIGRPSTYASIIHKVIERKYVEIKNIEGINRNSQQIFLDKKYKINESTKEVTLGKENNKLTPTELGIQVNNFMIENFSPIIEIKFTAEFEKYLDMIANGKAKWHNILDKFYKMFNPIVEELNSKLITIEKELKSDKLLGLHPETKNEIFIGNGKYGNYIKYNDKYTSLPDEFTLEETTLDDVLKIIIYPKDLGKYNKKSIYLCKGKFGFYIKYNEANISFNQEIDIDKIDIDFCKNLIESGDKYSLKTYKVKDKIINVKKGKFGPYLQLLNDKKKVLRNIPIPNNLNIENININDIIDLITKK